MQKKGTIVVGLLFVAGITGIYFFAWLAGTSEVQFTGFLANPLDSFSYLAKMRQGYDGAWLFTLPFTSSKSIPAFLFEYYLLLGHIARFTQISIVTIYHAARVFNSILMVWAIWEFLKIPGLVKEGDRLGLWSIIILGSGCGWIAAFWGATTADLWVAEAYPFLSAYTNPHFPLAIASILFLVKLSISGKSIRSLILCGLLSIVLAIIQPFGVVLVELILGINFLLDKYQKRESVMDWKYLVVIGGAALPFAGLYYWSIQRDPLLQLWNSQNITSSPAWWDVLLSFTPAIPAIVLGYIVSRSERNANRKYLWIWLLVGLGILLIPIQLQRRFLIGIYIPLTILAWNGLHILADRFHTISIQNLKKIYWVLAVPTNLLLLAIGYFGIQQKAEWYFYHSAELSTFQWLERNSNQDDVILSDPQTSLFLPGLIHRKVVYAHPYETPGALNKEKYFDECLTKFQSESCSSIIKNENVKWVVVNPYRIQIPADWVEPDYPMVYSDYRLRIYEVE